MQNVAWKLCIYDIILWAMYSLFFFLQLITWLLILYSLGKNFYAESNLDDSFHLVIKLRGAWATNGVSPSFSA